MRGPIMGRIVPGGLFLRANPKEQAESTRLGKLEDRGKGVVCQDMLEALPASTLAAGDYHLDVVVSHPNGDMINLGTAPLHVN